MQLLYYNNIMIIILYLYEISTTNCLRPDELNSTLEFVLF